MCPKDKMWAWNFRGFIANKGKPGLRTTEFRLPPGSVNLRQTVHWAAFTIGFVMSSLEQNYTSFTDKDWKALDDEFNQGHPSIFDLDKFICGGIATFNNTGNATCLSNAIDYNLTAVPPLEGLSWKDAYRRLKNDELLSLENIEARRGTRSRLLKKRYRLHLGEGERELLGFDQ